MPDKKIYYMERTVLFKYLKILLNTDLKIILMNDNINVGSSCILVARILKHFVVLFTIIEVYNLHNYFESNKIMFKYVPFLNTSSLIKIIDCLILFMSHIFFTQKCIYLRKKCFFVEIFKISSRSENNFADIKIMT